MANYWSKLLSQTAVYWGSPTVDGWGNYTFAAPVEVTVRWVDKAELFLDGNAKQQVSNAVVLLDQDVDVEGYLYLGTLDELDSAQEADPTAVDTAYQIKKVAKVPDVFAKGYLRKVWL